MHKPFGDISARIVGIDVPPLIVILVLAMRLPTLLAQQSFIDRTAQIKAAYLYNFGKYVQWPSTTLSQSSNDQPALVIGVVGESPVLEPLREIARTKTLHERKILIRQFRTVQDYEPCYLLFFPAGQDQDVANAVLKRAHNDGTLTVGETEGFAQRAGIINFYIERNRLRFEVNQELAKKAGLSISSRLLSLGKIVRAD